MNHRHTELQGAVIASTQAAVEAGRNRLVTGTLSTRDLENKDVYEARSTGVSAGTRGASAGHAQVGGQQRSTTRSGISGAEITITDAAAQQERSGQTAEQTLARVNREVLSGDDSGALRKRWDGQELQKQVQAGARIVESFGRQAAKAVGDYATDKARELRAQGNEEEARKWDEGGAYRVALHGSVGLLSGDVSGALGAAAGATLMPHLGEAIAELNLPEPVRQGLTAVVGTAVGAVAGSAGGHAAAGGTAALNETANNYLSRSPFASVRRAVSQENARLMRECGPHCTQADFDRIDRQVATLERSLTLSTLASRSTLTPEQAQQFTQTLLELAPVYGTAESFVQLITGKSSVTGEEASRFWAAVGVVPVAGGLVKKVGEPSVEALTQFFKGADTLKPVATPAEAAAAPSAVNAAQLNSELSHWTKIVPDTSRDAEYLAKTDRSVLQQYNFDLNHVLAGEINKNHKATGYHAEFAADGTARIKPDAQVIHHPNGTYEAPVQIWDASKGQWVDKQKESTFFPPSWSQARIEYEVAEAFKSRQADPRVPNKWIGTSPSGIVIEGYINRNRVTFYPTKVSK